jgi:hypothetical protein
LYVQLFLLNIQSQLEAYLPNDSTELDKKEDKPNDSTELDKGREKITQDEKVCITIDSEQFSYKPFFFLKLEDR